MQIPNVTIFVRTHTGLTRGELYYPEYFAAVLRAVYAGHLDVTAPGKGIEILPFPENGDPSMRYREVSGVAEELAFLRTMYGPSKGPKYADAVWTEETLKKEMERLLVAEHKRLQEVAKPKVLATAHPTFLAFGLTEDQARALQAAGCADRAACVGQSIVDLANVHSITIDLAGRLSAPDAKAEAKK